MKFIIFFLLAYNINAIEINNTYENLFIHLVQKYKTKNNKIINYAKSFLGIPYLWGGETNEGIDCSSYVRAVYKYKGVFLPRTSRQQYNDSRFVSVSTYNLMPMDLLFFRNEQKINHVGIYLGNNRFIHAAKKNGFVKIDTLFGDEVWERLFYEAKRLAKEQI